MVVRVGVDIDVAALEARLAAFPALLDRLVAGVLQRQAGVSEAYMRANAAWRDQTGNARAGLQAVATSSGHSHDLTLAHGVPYGIWLEVRYAGRYAIVQRSLQVAGADVMRLLDRGLARL